MEIFSEAILNIFPCNYLADTVKSIVATYRIIMILFKDFLSQ